MHWPETKIATSSCNEDSFLWRFLEVHVWQSKDHWTYKKEVCDTVSDPPAPSLLLQQKGGADNKLTGLWRNGQHDGHSTDAISPISFSSSLKSGDRLFYYISTYPDYTSQKHRVAKVLTSSSGWAYWVHQLARKANPPIMQPSVAVAATDAVSKHSGRESLILPPGLLPFNI